MENKHPMFLDLKLNVSRQQQLDYLIENDPNFGGFGDTNPGSFEKTISEWEEKDSQITSNSNLNLKINNFVDKSEIKFFQNSEKAITWLGNSEEKEENKFQDSGIQNGKIYK